MVIGELSEAKNYNEIDFAKHLKDNKLLVSNNIE